MSAEGWNSEARLGWGFISRVAGTPARTKINLVLHLERWRVITGWDCFLRDWGRNQSQKEADQLEEDCPIEGLEVIRKQNRVHSLKWSSSVGKESSCNAEDSGSISGLGRSPGEGNGNPLQYSCLEDPMHRETWQAAVHGIARVGHDLVTKPPPPLKWRKWMSEKPWRRWLPAKLGECQGLWLDQFLEGRGLSWSEGGTAEGKSYTSQVTVKSSTWTRRGWLCGAAEIQEPGNQSSEIIGSSWGVRRGHPLWFHSVCEHAHVCVCFVQLHSLSNLTVFHKSGCVISKHMRLGTITATLERAEYIPRLL